jgi:predicted Ser/Thr protein kinase
MPDATVHHTICPHCGAGVAAQAPEGLCPRCVAALSLTGDTGGGGDARLAAPPLTPQELAPHFPQLEIIEFLGRGGMGVVYKARQKTLNRIVALKLLAPERETDAKFAERFSREAQALAALNHPHIVTVHDFGQVAGLVSQPDAANGAPTQSYFLLMEFVDGVNLRQAMKAARFMPERALAIVPPVCEALQFAHEHGIVHRDIKPENLLLDKDDRVKIADFGIAQMMGGDDSSVGFTESQPAGTPQYMAPEQKDHQRTDRRADIYSLGVVLHELLTGELPPGKIEPPRSAGLIKEPLNRVVRRALEEDPELRYQTAAELRRDLEMALGSGLRKICDPRRSSWAKITLAAAALLLAAALAFAAIIRTKKAAAGIADSVDFDSGELADSFNDNVLFGGSPYLLAPVGVNHTRGVSVKDSLASEGTLVYKKRSYDLSALTSLEVSCFFKRRPIGAAPHALNLGLTQTSAGHLSGVAGDAFIGMRLLADGESLRMQFQSKAGKSRSPNASKPGEALPTVEGKWYQLKAAFSRVDATTICVTGEVSMVSDSGVVGNPVGYFPATNFWVGDFHFAEIAEDHAVWVAMRANGAGGTEALDNLRIAARPLPLKTP